MASFNFRFSAQCLAIVSGFLLAQAATAQLYRWTDEKGKVHYSDTVPPTDVDRARKEIRSDGTVKKQIDRALTPEERRAAAIKAAEDEKVRIAKAERERKDKALLVTYATLADFDRVRDRAIAAVDAEVTASTNRLYTLNTQRTTIKKEIDVAGKRPSLKLNKELDAVESEIADGSAFQSKRIRDRVQLVVSYQEERIRLADLIAAEAAVNKPAAVAPSASAANTKKKS